MKPLLAFRSLTRRCVAGIAMFGFSLNVATPTAMHGCAHVPSEMRAPGAAAHSAHHGHQADPTPADQSSDGGTCHCVGHSCGSALAVPAPRAAGLCVVPVITLAGAVPGADRLPAVDQLLLPFAVGPPRSILA